MFILYVVDDFVEPHHYDNDASMVVIPARLNSKLMLSSSVAAKYFLYLIVYFAIYREMRI